MNVEELVRDSLRELADEQTSAGPGFADRVLVVRRRRRSRRLALVATATAAVVVAVAVPMLDSGKEDVRPADVVQRDEINAHPDQSPPRELISAGNTVLAAYYVHRTVKHSADQAERVRDYWLLDPRTGRYVKTTKWSYVAVAPGLKTAAVLERNLPASRIGLLDLTTGKIDQWIQVDHKVAGLSFSRDGLKLVATTYGDNPDALVRMEGAPDGWDTKQPSSRTGFYVLDAASGKGSWSEVKLDSDPNDPMGGFLNSRQDFALSPDGRHVWAGNPMGDIGKQFYDLTGTEVAVPANQKYLEWYVDAWQSPSGNLVAGGFMGKKWKTSSVVIDARTGKQTEVRGQQLLAWVGDTSLIAWDMAKDGKNEFHQQLVQVTIGSAKTVPLSGFRKGNDGDGGRWEPVFAER